MESGFITDTQIRASSSVDQYHTAEFARLNNESSWQARSDDHSPWIEVSFQQRMILTGNFLKKNSSLVTNVSKYIRSDAFR